MTFSRLIAAVASNLALISGALAQGKPVPPPTGDKPSVVTAEELSKIEQAISGNTANGNVQDASQTAQEILSRPEFRDAGVAKSRNWLSDAFENFFEALFEFISGLFRAPEFTGAPPMLSIPPWTTSAVWVILILAVIAFLVWALSKISWGAAAKLRKKSVGGLLDEDEPDRTADEWLTRADELAAEGRHREAVRCLYLACLVRVDEAGVARFRRGETNWEHLYRINNSRLKPEALDFKTPTQRFDLVWYGYQGKGQSDVDEFRTFYVDLCKKLQIPDAA